MKRTADKELPTLWECIKPVFEKMQHIPKQTKTWFQPTVYHEKNVANFTYDNKQKSKKIKLNIKPDKLLKTRKIGLTPTKKQISQLDIMLQGAAHAYNLALKLQRDEDVKLKDLQKFVSKQDRNILPPKLQMKNDDWFYSQVPSTVKQHALKQYLSARSAIFAKCHKNKTNGKRNKYSIMKEKDIFHIRSGWFGVQAKQMKLVNEEKRKTLNDELHKFENEIIELKQNKKTKKWNEKKKNQNVVRQEKRKDEMCNVGCQHFREKRKKVKTCKGHRKKRKKYNYHYLFLPKIS